MVSLSRHRSATYADLEALPEDQKAELLDGELFLMTAPRARHIQITSVLGALLGSRFGLFDGPSDDGPGGWWILHEPEVHLVLDRQVVRPDLAGWRRERLPRLDADSHKLTLVPDWICEVVSPRTLTYDLLRKMPRYLAAGVRWAWIVDPEIKRVEVYRAVDGEPREWLDVVSFAGQAVAEIPPFDGASLDLGPCW
ncbi:MAG: Uma2 family endonuclease [Deltaproteobacteria bacterium]|nr:Uma2 family endonuclease [Deltaproteobacteria bacterium]